MQTAIIIIIYTVVNLTIIYNGGNNFAVGWLMAFRLIWLLKLLNFILKEKPNAINTKSGLIS